MFKEKQLKEGKQGFVASTKLMQDPFFVETFALYMEQRLIQDRNF
jgi:hypothetical protein